MTKYYFFKKRGNSNARVQSGAAAVEFALIFPLLFAFTYATIVYGYVFYIQQTLNFIAQEAVRSVTAVNPSSPGYMGLVNSAASASVASSLGKFPIKTNQAIAPTYTPGTDGLGAPTYAVTLALPVTALSGFATIKLPFIGLFPPLPVTLRSTAVVNLR